jgi:hypothetical protein
MTYFAEMIQESTGYPSYTDKDKKLIPACGMNSVVYLDGRFTLEKLIESARDHAVKYKYPAFRVCKGATIARDIRPLTDVISTTGDSLKYPLSLHD